MASKDISEIHLQSCVILEKLCDARDITYAQLPDPAFIQEYFKILQEELNLTPEDTATPRGPHSTEAKLSQQDRGLVEVIVSSKKEKFVVNSLKPCE